jgi:hypothetical protein
MRTSWAILKMTTSMKMRARSRCRSRDPVAHGESPERLAAPERTVTEDSNGRPSRTRALGQFWDSQIVTLRDIK